MDLQQQGKNYTNFIERIVYKGADKKKLNIKEFKKEIYSSYEYAILCVAQEIMNRDIEKAYLSPEEIIGDLQVMLKDAFQEIRTKAFIKTRTLEVEHILKEYEEAKK